MGKLIVIEGADCSGKTTISRLLAVKCKDTFQYVTLDSEPTNTEIGYLIKQVLKGRAQISEEALLHLFVADRIDHTKELQSTLLKRDTIVILDRYYYSTFCYQSLKFGFGYLDTLHDLRPNLILKPDLTIILDASLDVILSRIKVRNNRELFEQEDKLRVIVSNYRRIKQLSLFCRNDNIHYVESGSTEDISRVVDQCYSLICNSGG